MKLNRSRGAHRTRRVKMVVVVGGAGGDGHLLDLQNNFQLINKSVSIEKIKQMSTIIYKIGKTEPAAFCSVAVSSVECCSPLLRFLRLCPASALLILDCVVVVLATA